MGLRPHFLMLINTKKTPNWREDASLTCEVEYKKKFAWLRVSCSDGTKVWFKSYYKKYEHWVEVSSTHGYFDDDRYCHTDFVEYVSEADYIVRILTEGLSETQRKV